MEAMQKVADGKATKLIVPSDMQNLAATVSAIKEISGEVTGIKFYILFSLPAVFCRGQFYGDERWRQKGKPLPLRSA